jgi:hypothetical protein
MTLLPIGARGPESRAIPGRILAGAPFRASPERSILASFRNSLCRGPREKGHRVRVPVKLQSLDVPEQRDRVRADIHDPNYIVPRWTIFTGLWDMYFWVDYIDALFKEFVERGAKIDYGLCDQPYGCREFGTQDIDGHDIGFGQIVS